MVIRRGDDAEFKVILRFSEEKGVHDMSPVKLTTILKNQVGDVKMAKVLRDGEFTNNVNKWRTKRKGLQNERDRKT